MKARLNNRTLLLSAAVLLVVAVTVIVIRRRGRKVYIAEPYRLNENEYIYINYKSKGASDFESHQFFKGTLDYVVVPWNYKDDVWTRNGVYYYPVTAIGYKMPDGKVRRVKFDSRAYIASRYIGISY